jgi:hypothetical protein
MMNGIVLKEFGAEGWQAFIEMMAEVAGFSVILKIRFSQNPIDPSPGLQFPQKFEGGLIVPIPGNEVSAKQYDFRG